MLRTAFFTTARWGRAFVSALRLRPLPSVPVVFGTAYPSLGE